MLPPFSFPKPLLYILEGTNTKKGKDTKYMALFEIQNGTLIGQGDGMSFISYIGSFMSPSADADFKIFNVNTSSVVE
jgi:hypothetical protein